MRISAYLFILSCCLVADLAQAQSASAGIAYGSLTNFDTVNDTGTECHGFEIELEDCHSTDISRTYNYNHYGVPRIFEDDSVPEHPVCTVRWESRKNPDGSWASYTAVPDGPISPTNGHQFTNPNVNFGGEHFGVSYRMQPTAVRYFWLVDDGSGNLVRGGQVQVAAPTFRYFPAQGVVPARVQAAVEPPEPPEIPVVEFGPALWVREIRTTSHNNREIHLRDLVSDDPDDDDDLNWRNGEPDEVEVEWSLLQTEFSNPGAGMGELAAEPEDLHNGDEVVTRRWEFFEYIGPFDEESREAKADKVGDDGIHGEGVKTINGVEVDLSTVEVVGEFKGAQMAAVDVDAGVALIDHLSDGVVNEVYADRTVVIQGSSPFTASSEGALPSGMTFNDVTGVLSGTPTETGQFNFTVTANDGVNAGVSKNFVFSIYAENVAPPPASLVDTTASPVSGGSTTGDGSYAPGTDVTVTAEPEPGYVFVSWIDGGKVVSQSKTHTFKIDVNHSLVASFEEAPAGPRPDATVGKNPNRQIGDDIYSPGGAGQKIRQVSFRGRKLTSYFGVQNDGSLPDTITVTGTSKDRNFRALYFRTSGSRTNLTALLSRRGYRAELEGLAEEQFELIVKPARRARHRAKSFLINATSIGSTRDRIVIQVKVK
jgi:hypothetical protein